MTEAVEYIHLQPEAAPPTIHMRPPFRAVVIAETNASPKWQSLVSDWLVRSGCLYMMSWGRSCSSWDDSVDFANLNQFDYGEIPEDKFVMTTWHTNESLEEVFWFAKNNAFHPTVDLKRTVLVLLHISATNRENELMKAYANA